MAHAAAPAATVGGIITWRVPTAGGSLSSRSWIGASSLMTTPMTRGGTRPKPPVVQRTVRAGRGRAKGKSASPVKGGGRAKKKKMGDEGVTRRGGGRGGSADGSKSARPDVGPVMVATQGTTLADILAQDAPMDVIEAAPPAPPSASAFEGSGGGGKGRSNGGGSSWADALADFRSETASKETERNMARAQVLAEEESFFEVGDRSRMVAFGAGQRAVDDDEWEGGTGDDNFDGDIVFIDESFDEDDDNDASHFDSASDIEMRYRQGQARGAVEFDLDEDGVFLDGGAEGAGEKRDRGIPFEMRCFDTAKIFVKAGDGGRGMVAFRREAFVAQGGPYGGNGGNGGAVFFEVDESINSLVRFRKKVHHRAEAGGNGGGKKMQGSNGADKTVLVPPGTVIRNSKSGEVLAEMCAHGHREMVIPGGRGGRGNASFKTAKNKAPQIAENGEEGGEMWVEMELKVVADVGIIGVPNAGKSTLLAGISNAKPKIADYPFTTIVPNLGVVERDFERMVFADIPGLLEGASEGIGLGFEFLRHVKRTRVLVHVLDCTSEDVLYEYDAIRNELFLFDEEVGEKPEFVVLNKVDASEEAAVRAQSLFEMFKQERGVNAYVISALTGQGTNELINAVKEVWSALPAPDYEAEAKRAAQKRISRPADGKALDDFKVIDTPYAFIVEGEAIERFVQMTNWDYFESFKRFARVLQMSGVERAINEAGAGEGDRVVIGKYEFEWSGDRREQALFDSWKAKQDEKPAGTTQQGSRHWPH